jgi:alkylation response protein AidB-like acyl-CoA dehydrogenase
MIRDLRINLIFEGSSEIMRLFIAREAVDDHLRVAGDMIDPRAPVGKRIASLLKAGLHYAWWFPTRFLGWGHWPRYRSFGSLARHLRYVDRAARRLSRQTFYAMIRFGPSLEKRQAVLGRIVDIGADLFVMTAACVRARKMQSDDPSDSSAVTLADLFCRQARRRIEDAFDAVFFNDDTATYDVARQAMDGRFAWLEEGVIGMKEAYGSTGAPKATAAVADRPTEDRQPEPAGAD